MTSWVGRDLEREQLKDLAKEESAAQEQFNLHCLTGNPITSDTILYALPMCAPYSVVRNNRFRVKVLLYCQQCLTRSH